MMYYLLMFAVFLLVMQFAFALLPLVLPVILIFWLFSIFKNQMFVSIHILILSIHSRRTAHFRDLQALISMSCPEENLLKTALMLNILKFLNTISTKTKTKKMT